MDSTLNTNQRESILSAIEQLKLEVSNVRDTLKFNGSDLVASYDHDNPNNDGYFQINVPKIVRFRFGAGTDMNTEDNTFSVSSSIITVADQITMASTSASPSTVDITMAENHIKSLLSYISNTGSAIERLKHKEDRFRSQITVNEAVQSNYEDADFAKEQMELMKVQILQQTATAALAQANSAPQSVLSLFR